MATFIALYRGESVNTAKMVGLSANPDVVKRFAQELLNDPHYAEDAESDPILSALSNGKRTALRLISTESQEAAR